MTENVKLGTTTIGLVCKDGVVVASEHRATMGYMIAHKETQKVFKISDHLAMTTAGLVGDAQLLVRWLSAESELFNLKRDAEMSVKAAATLMANILSGRRMFPYWVQLLVVGVDPEGGHVYSLDAVGGAIPDNYISTGSGSPYVYGVLEDQYKEGISTGEGADLAVRGLNAAIKRDAASGNGMDIVIITKRGYKQLTKKEIDDRKKKMGIE